MAGLPTVQVLLDDGTGTFPYDITAYARLNSPTTISRGRQDEQSQVTPGQLTLTLKNTDGRFTPGSTIIASPSPIKADARIRVKYTANSTTVNRFTGYVQSWPVAWPSGGQELSEVTITATDAQARAERRTLRSVIEEEILADSPAAYYTLGEPAEATQAADSSGSQQPNLVQIDTGTAVVFGTATGPSTDGLTAAQFGGGLTGRYLDSSLPLGFVAVECFFLRNGALSGGHEAILSASDGSTSVSLSINSGSEDLWIFQSAGGGASGEAVSGSPVVSDGAIHHVFWNVTTGAIYLDGSLLDSANGLTVAAPTLFSVGGGRTNTDALLGVIAHGAAYTSNPAAGRIAAHASSGLNGFAGESGTARITRLAGYANLPLGTLDTSLTNAAFTDITGKSASEALLQVADAEMGLLFTDGSGNLTFHNRNKVAAKTTPDLTQAAIQLAEDTAFVTDMQGVLNYYEVTAVGTSVTQVARDTTSETNHGRYPGSANYLVQTDAEALDRGNWVINTHKEPGPRAGTLSVDLLSMTAAEQASWLAVEPNHWIRVTGLPSQTPGGTTVDFIVQGFGDTLQAGDNSANWVLTLNVADKATVYPSVWILGDTTYSVLGSTTRLYV